METSPPSSSAPLSTELKVDKYILEYLTEHKDELREKLKMITITDKDIHNLEPYPSDYRLAYFASEVYNDNCTIPDDWDWKLLIRATNTNSGNGYVGAAFFNPIQQQIIIGHRGMDSLTDAWDDLKSVVWGSFSAQIHSALTFSDFIRSVIVELQSEKMWRYQLSFTGHSLGGFLAQVTTFGVKYLKRDDDVFLKSTDAGIHGHCVSFDNPGCAEMLDRIIDHCDLRYLRTIIFPSTLDITAYLSAPNKVNMCNRHVGVLLRLQLPFQKMPCLSAHTPHCHLKTHIMDIIKSVFDPKEEKINVEVDQIFDWPVTDKDLIGFVFSNEEYRDFFKFSTKKTNFKSNIKRNVVSSGVGRFDTIRYLPKAQSENSCNASFFSEDELFLLKHWLKIVQSPITINETFAPLNRSFKDLFFQFKQIGDDLMFPDKTSMNETIKRCKQIVRWYPEDIKKCLSSLLSKSFGVIMKVAVDSYNESFNNCNVDFKDSFQLEYFLIRGENVLLIKPYAYNYFEIEMLRLFNVFKQIRSKQNVIIDKYTGEDNFLFVNQSYLLTLFQYTELNLFLNSQLNFLIVDLLNETINDDVLNLINRFAKGVRKVVIVSGSKINLSSTSSKEITAYNFEFTDLTVESQKWAKNYEIIKLQNETYSLVTFFNETDNSWCFSTGFLFDYKFLDRILNDRYIELKSDSLNLTRLENFYIQANNDQSYSYKDFVKLIENSECDLSKSKILITHVSCRLSLQISCDQLQTADLNEASQYFKELCNEDSTKKFYWFHYDQNVSLKQIYDPQLYIPRSFYYEIVLDESKVTDSIKEELLRQEKEGSNKSITVELEKPDEYFSRTYNFRVDRRRDKVTYVWDEKDNRITYNNRISDIRHFLTLSRDRSLAEQELVDRGVVLITGDPRIGKSTTVANLISKIEHSWVFKLTYNDCTTIVKRLNGKFGIEHISDQLLKLKSNNEFDVLEYHLAYETHIKVVILFDEIFVSSHDIHNERSIIEFLKYLRDKTKSLLIVTSRETNREMLEDALQTFSIQFKRLNRKDVERYLTNYWSDLFHLDFQLKRLTLNGLNDYIKRLLDKVEAIFDPKALNLVGIPLQMKLLAEVAAPDYSSLSKPSPDGIQLELPDSLTGIYEGFVEKKLAIVCNKLRLGELYSVKKVYLESIDKQLRAFSASKYGFYDDNFDELEALQQTGLIRGSEFIHKTIQEFYFARQTFAWLKKRNGRCRDKRPELAEFLLEEIFASPDFSIVRMFLETYISKITPEDAPFYTRKMVETFKEHDNKTYPFKDMAVSASKRLFSRLMWEHCQGTIIFLLESFKNHHETETFLPLLTEKDSFSENVLCLACQFNQTLVIDYFVRFLQTQSKETQNQITIASFFRLPEKRFLNALENFIARFPAASESNIKEIANLIKKDIGLLNDLMLASAENSSLEIVRKCLKNVSDTLKPHLLDTASDHRSGDNALHLAIEYDHPEIVRLLIEHGSNVNRGNFYSITPIALACYIGNFEILRYLVENGGDYMKGDYRGVTPFHRAVREGHAVLVEYFLEELKYDGVNEENLFGETALYHAVWIREKKIVKMLLKHLKPDCIDLEYESGRPLDWAIQSRDLKLVKMIVKAGATIDYKDSSGMSPIETAKNFHNMEDIVQYLIESRSNQYESE